MGRLKRYATLTLVCGAVAVALICWFRLRLATQRIERISAAHVRTIAERDGLLAEARRRRVIVPPERLKEVVRAGARVVRHVQADVATRSDAPGGVVVQSRAPSEFELQATDEHERFSVWVPVSCSVAASGDCDVAVMPGARFTAVQRWRLSGVEVAAGADDGTRYWSVTLEEASPKTGETINTYQVRAGEIAAEYVPERRSGLRRFGWTAGVGVGAGTGGADAFAGVMWGVRW